MKKIGLLCLFLASLGLVGCFHIPDEDWLPSKSNTETGDIQKDEEMEQALDLFVGGFKNISSERDEIKNNENTEEGSEINVESGNEATIEDETINNEEIANDEIIYEVENEIVEENISSEE